MKPTEQQQAVVARRVRPGETLPLIACAGTGQKTAHEPVARPGRRRRCHDLCVNRDTAR